MTHWDVARESAGGYDRRRDRRVWATFRRACYFVRLDVLLLWLVRRWGLDGTEERHCRFHGTRPGAENRRLPPAVFDALVRGWKAIFMKELRAWMESSRSTVDAQENDAERQVAA